MIRDAEPRLAAWKLVLEYDGSRYRGWQAQKNAPSVQDALRRAAEEVLGAPVEVQGAGRTDAGVHALGQVAHVKTANGKQLTKDVLKLRLNQELPSDLVVLEVEPVSPRFHARHHARSRTYLYRISLRKTAFAKRFSWWVKEPLRIDVMQRAAAALVGRHDFAAFSARDLSRPDESTIVVVERCEVDAEGDELLVRIEASHFLWKMVRRIVGVLVRVGTGEFPEAGWTDLLKGKVRPGVEVAAWTAPASGLFLESVDYSPDSRRRSNSRQARPL